MCEKSAGERVEGMNGLGGGVVGLRISRIERVPGTCRKDE